MGTFPSAACGICSEEYGVAATWRLASEPARTDRALVATGRAPPKYIEYRDVAQMVARLVWERAVVFGCDFQKSEQSGEKRRKRERIVIGRR